MDLHLNQAVLFKNTKKPRGTSQPDWIGTINIDGTVRKISLWFRKAKSNGSFYLLGNNEPIEVEVVKEAEPLQSHEYKQQKKGKPKF